MTNNFNPFSDVLQFEKSIDFYDAITYFLCKGKDYNFLLYQSKNNQSLKIKNILDTLR